MVLVALHGKGDSAARFEKEARGALPDGWALLVPEAPGNSWYFYDGDTPAFRESLGRAADHVVAVLRRVRLRGRAFLLGFSQGAYLAGVLAVRRPDLFAGAVLAGGRLKHEILGPDIPEARRRGLRVLALHGREDALVRPDPARASIEAVRAAGLDAEFRLLEGRHAFTPEMRREAREWLRNQTGRRSARRPVDSSRARRR